MRDDRHQAAERSSVLPGQPRGDEQLRSGAEAAFRLLERVAEQEERDERCERCVVGGDSSARDRQRRLVEQQSGLDPEYAARVVSAIVRGDEDVAKGLRRRPRDGRRRRRLGHASSPRSRMPVMSPSSQVTVIFSKTKVSSSASGGFDAPVSTPPYRSDTRYAFSSSIRIVLISCP